MWCADRGNRQIVVGLMVSLGMVVLNACQSHELSLVEPKAVEVLTTTIVVEGKQYPPNVMLVVDRSGSMTRSATGTGMACTLDGAQGSDYDSRSPYSCKWNDLKSALADPSDGFLVRNQQRARFGLLPFPSDAGTCAPGAIEVPIGDDVQPIRDFLLNRVAPRGGTPTAATVLEAAKDPSLSQPESDRHHFIMLLTDGLPNCNENLQSLCVQCRENSQSCGQKNGCRPTEPPLETCGTSPFEGASCLDEEGLVEAITRLRSQGIVTFVIGFGIETAREDASRVLDRAAQAGGHPRVGAKTQYYQANSVQELTSFLEEILQSFPCTFTLSTPIVDPQFLSVSVADKREGGEVLLRSGQDWFFTNTDREGVRLEGKWCAEIQNAPEDRYLVHFRYARSM